MLAVHKRMALTMIRIAAQMQQSAVKEPAAGITTGPMQSMYIGKFRNFCGARSFSYRRHHTHIRPTLFWTNRNIGCFGRKRIFPTSGGLEDGSHWDIGLRIAIALAWKESISFYLKNQRHKL